MKSIEEIKQDARIRIQELGIDGGLAYVLMPDTMRINSPDGGYDLVYKSYPNVFNIIFSFGGGWDHVSVSRRDRCCTWEEMCQIKDIFFNENECVVQYHPPKSEYVNRHPYCLHLWKPQNITIPLPPKEMV